MNYAPIMKYGDAVVLPIQAIIGALSIKRKLYKQHLAKEIASLTEIGSRAGGFGYPKPYLSIIAFDSAEEKIIKAKDDVFESISAFYKPKTDYRSREHCYSWNELLDSVIVFDKFIIKGANLTPNDNKQREVSKYLWTGGNGTKRNLYIQHLLDGIHRAWYDSRRGSRPVGSLLAIPRGGMQKLGDIKICVEDRKYTWHKFTPPINTSDV